MSDMIPGDPTVVCTDCLMILANDDDTGMPHETAEHIRWMIGVNYLEYGMRFIPACDDCEWTCKAFSVASCQCCNTDLAGARHLVNTMFVPERNE